MTVFCAIVTPGSLTVKAGKDVVFKWNTTNRILVVNWGITNLTASENVAPKFIYADISGAVNIQPGVASTSYNGRVSFVGNLTAGRAWFKITNLIASDTNTYAAEITEAGQAGQFSPVTLQVTGTVI